MTEGVSLRKSAWGRLACPPAHMLDGNRMVVAQRGECTAGRACVCVERVAYGGQGYAYGGQGVFGRCVCVWGAEGGWVTADMEHLHLWGWGLSACNLELVPKSLVPGL